MLRKIFTVGWYLLSALIILIAVAMVIARGYPSLYQKYLPTIQENFSSVLGKPVRADSINIEWQGIVPVISTRNLTIYADDSQYEQLLNVDKATISLDLYKSILQKKIIFKELTFVDGNLEAIRTIDERILLNGIDISERLSKQKQLAQNTDFNINLLDSSISIIDEVKKLDYYFDRVDILLGVSGEHFKVTSKFTLPSTLGESLEIFADIRDLDKGFKRIKGKFYAHGANINLELINDFFPTFRAGVKKGYSDFQVWGNFNSLDQSTIVGSLAARDLVYNEIQIPIPGINSDDEITAINTLFQLKGDINNWQIALDNTLVETASTKWPAQQFALRCYDCERQNVVFSASLGYLNTDQLFSTLQRFPFVSKQLSEVLENIELQGTFQDIMLTAKVFDKRINKYAYQATLKDVDISIPKQEFAVTSVSGKVSGDHTSGHITLDSNQLGFKHNKILNHSLENQNVSGSLRWQHAENKILLAIQDFFVQSNEMQAKVQGLVQVNDAIPFIDIQVDIPEVHASTIKKYIPYKRMNPKLSKWLIESITSGTLKNGKLLFHGNQKYFPFKNKPGRFQVIAEIEAGSLDYRQDWPNVSNINADFEINNNYLVLSAQEGTILDSSLNHVKAEIKDLKLPRLEITGNASGPAKNILKYLQQSSLLPEDSKVIKHITVNGNTTLDLDLTITLTKKLEKQRLVKGVLEFDNSGLIVNALSLPFTHLNGKLRFDQNGAEGEDLTAKLYGAPIQLSATKKDQGRTLITVTGDLDLDSYLGTNFQKLNEYIKGTAPLQARVDIPGFNKANLDKSLMVDVRSDLYGVVSLFPEPFFQKLFDESKQLSIKTRHQEGLDTQIYANLNNDVFMQADINQDNSQIIRMEVRIGDDEFLLPEEGIKISGSMSELDLAEWRNLIDSEDEQPFDLRLIDLKLDQVSLGKLTLNNVDFFAQRNSQFWSGDINSSIVKGQFEYPVDPKSGSVATASFDYLRFNPVSDTVQKSETNIDPRDLPAMVVNAKQFEYKDAVLSNVSLKTKPSNNGVMIDSLQASGSDLQINANGTWSVVGDDAQVTELDIRLVTNNMQNSLTGLGFESAVIGGEGSIMAKFKWPKAPYQFSLENFSGHANLRFNEGAISSVEPGGAGRLVGLFNFGEITRRLSLDFTDFFSKGYSFEKIRGDLEFNEGNLTTDNLKIKGPSADILIQGRTGITTRDYDQVVTVSPHVSGGLPWIGLAVGGPLGAVGVLVGEKIAQSIGMDVNKVTEVKYSMTGSWDEPKIEPIAQKIADQKSSTQGQPSPNSPPQNTPQLGPPSVSSGPQ